LPFDLLTVQVFSTWHRSNISTQFKGAKVNHSQVSLSIIMSDNFQLLNHKSTLPITDELGNISNKYELLTTILS